MGDLLEVQSRKTVSPPPQNRVTEISFMIRFQQLLALRIPVMELIFPSWWGLFPDIMELNCSQKFTKSE